MTDNRKTMLEILSQRLKAVNTLEARRINIGAKLTPPEDAIRYAIIADIRKLQEEDAGNERPTDSGEN